MIFSRGIMSAASSFKEILMKINVVIREHAEAALTLSVLRKYSSLES